MSTVRLEPLLHQPWPESARFVFPYEYRKSGRLSRVNWCYKASVASGSRGCLCYRNSSSRRALRPIRAGVAETPLAEAPDSAQADVLFKETFPLKRTQMMEGKVSVKLDKADGDNGKPRLIVGCNLEGKWILHWGVTYPDDFSSEWDQPPLEMRPPGSVPVKDYAIETPLKKSSSTLEGLYEVEIDLKSSSSISAIHFVLKEEETGAWYQYRGRDFKIPLLDQEEDELTVSEKKGFSIWPGALSQISTLLSKTDESTSRLEDSVKEGHRAIEAYYKEYPILKEEAVQNSMTVSVRRDNESDKNVVYFDTDIPGDVIVHWGVCRDGSKKWEFPTPPHPQDTKIFRGKALRTLLQPKANGSGSCGLFPVDKEFSCLLFVLKLNEYTWLNNMGSDFCISLISEDSMLSQAGVTVAETEHAEQVVREQVTGPTDEEDVVISSRTEILKETIQDELESPSTVTPQEVQATSYTDEIINDIRSLVTDISAEKGNITKSKETQENILQEIEKLAAEAYGIFRSSIPVFVEEPVSDAELLKPQVKIPSGTGSGYEVLLQGFNWESHRSGKWYTELYAKAPELASLGFTVIWLPPPTESVSPEGYMPKDLYNLNSRYGNMEELKGVVKRLHEVGIKVLGDVVLNHRCAHFQNKNGIWNLFGGRLNWDDRAIVSDDPHFQGRGNKSSGDTFHAAPNIDHSQEFVRKDLKEWLCWLREEIGYDGWRLDFVRGFWGGYVKDYLEASEPYFAVGEYWDSLSYTYGQMDYNQDAHRQRIIDWINATGGNASAFDVTTKGILHTALEKCEYWRLSDEKGKPPGVMGWWPSRAVTFIENHDTGSTQGHWRFPSGREMQGYAYILTHPGTPTVFYDHVVSHYHQEIGALMSVRHRNKLNCRSSVKILRAERDVYAAEIGEKVAVKIGPGHFEPPHGSRSWNVAAEGKEYKVWETT